MLMALVSHDISLRPLHSFEPNVFVTAGTYKVTGNRIVYPHDSHLFIK